MSDIETLRDEVKEARDRAVEFGDTIVYLDLSDIDAILAHLSPPDLTTQCRAQLVADLIEEYQDELTKEACDQCERCGQAVMCDFHSLLSALAGRTWTGPAMKRNEPPARTEPKPAPPDLRGLVEQWRNSKPPFAARKV